MAYGQVAADVIQSSVTGVSLGAGNASIMKNRIINGAMVIDQRNSGASVTPASAAYTLDRWQAYQSTASKFSVQQNAGSVTPPIGFTNYLGAISLSAYSVSSSDFFSIQQNIEGYNISDLGWGTANAKTVTLSFQVYSSLTGTFGGAFRNNGGTRSYPFTYTISSANTWTTISVTIAGDTSGTWLTTNGLGLTVLFSLGAGSTLSGTAGSWSGGNYTSATGATSVVGTNGATFYITGVQLEVGSSATGFEYRQYGQELALCQRYYAKLQSGSSSYAAFGSGLCNTSTQMYVYLKYPVSMRSSPTISYLSVRASFGGSAASISSVGNLNAGLDSASWEPNVASGGTAGRGIIVQGDATTSAYVDFSSEL
jgi:hypothetical protein